MKPLTKGDIIECIVIGIALSKLCETMATVALKWFGG